MLKNICINSNKQQYYHVVSLFIKPYSILFRIFSKENIKNIGSNAEYVSEEILKTDANCINKKFKYNNEDFYCIYEKETEIDDSIWKPYKELYFVISLRSFVGEAAYFVDKFAETYISKMNHKIYNKRFKASGQMNLIRILVLPNTDLTSCPKAFNEFIPLYTNQAYDQTYEYSTALAYKEIFDNWKNYWIPSIQLTCNDTIQSNQYITFSIKAFHKDNQECLDEVNYYIEPIQGYAPNKEIKIINGEGTGKIYALGLNPGDKLRFKINSKYWTDLAEKVLTVV